MQRRRNFSHKRQAILDAIKSTKEHPNAEWVYDQLKPTYPNLSLGTVYRNIAEFKESGDVISVGVVNGFDRLDGHTEPHPHFVCTMCHAVIDVDVDTQDEAVCRQISEEYGIECDHVELTVYGTCQSCLNSQKEKNKS